MKTEEEELILKQDYAKANIPYSSVDTKNLNSADLKGSSFVREERKDLRKKPRKK